jgi:hypothetical protein
MELLLIPVGILALGFTAFVLVEKLDKYLEEIDSEN